MSLTEFNCYNLFTIFNDLEYKNISKLSSVDNDGLIDALKARFNDFFKQYSLETIPNDMKNIFRAYCIVVLYKILISTNHYDKNTVETIRDEVLPNYFKELKYRKLKNRLVKCLLERENSHIVDSACGSFQWDMKSEKYVENGPSSIAKRVKIEVIVEKILQMRDRESVLNVYYSSGDYVEMLQQEFGYKEKSAESAYLRGISYINARMIPGTHIVLDMTEPEAIYFNIFKEGYESYESIDEYADRNHIINLSEAERRRFEETRIRAFNGGFETYNELIEYRKAVRDDLLGNFDGGLKSTKYVPRESIGKDSEVNWYRLKQTMDMIFRFSGLDSRHPNKLYSNYKKFVSNTGYHVIPMKDIDDDEIREKFCMLCEIYLEYRAKVPSENRKHHDYLFCDNVIIPTYKHLLEIHRDEPLPSTSDQNIFSIVSSLKQSVKTKKDLVKALKELPDKTNLNEIVREALKTIFQSDSKHISRDTKAILQKIN